MTMKTFKITVSCIFALTAWTPDGALAAFQLSEQNASGLGNAYAGQAAAAENASTIYFNPAGMSYLPGRQITGSLHAIHPSIKFSDDGTSRSPAGIPAPAGGDNGGNAGGWIYVPNVDLSLQITPQFWAGIGVTTPFGLRTEYARDFIGRFQSQKAELKTLDVNPSFAYKIDEFFSLGAGISYQRVKLELDRSFFAGAELPEKISLSDGAWGWNAGMMYAASAATRFGATYRSALSYRLDGTLEIGAMGSAKVAAKLDLPETVSLALSHEFDGKWQLLGDVSWTRWSRVQNVPLVLTSALGAAPAGSVVDTLDLKFRDGYRVGVGLNHRWSERTLFKGGVAYEATPVPGSTHRTTLLPDSDRTWLAIGAKHRLSEADVLDVGYAHLFLRDSEISRSKGFGLAGQGTVNGTYSNAVDIFSIQYTHSF
jgi:long-chain fatty acid transport protein